MRTRCLKVSGASAVYHCMSHTVSGTPYFDDFARGVAQNDLASGGFQRGRVAHLLHYVEPLSRPASRAGRGGGYRCRAAAALSRALPEGD